MAVLLVDRLRGRRERRISKSTYGDDNHVSFATRLPKDCRAAVRAKMECDVMTAVGRPCVMRCAPFRLNIFAPEERSDPVGAARSLLTGKAMTKGNRGRFALATNGELPAGACCRSFHIDASAPGGKFELRHYTPSNQI